MIRKTTRVLALALIVILAACGGGKSPSDAPANVTVAAGDQRAIVRWTQQSGLTYWIFRAVASVITRDNYSTFPEAHLEASVTTPHSVIGLNNGETYAFMMNATDGNGPAGPTSPSVSAAPRLSGDIWTSLPVAAGGHDLNDVIYGTLNTVNNFYAVGKTASIIKGTEVLDPINDSGNTVTWTVQSSPPGFTQDLNGIAFNTAGPTFVAVGNSGSVLVSTDGVIWGAGNVSSTLSPNLNAVANNGANFVAVGAGGVIYSGDGTTWTQRTSTTASTLNDVKFLSGQFIVVGDGGFIATSTDGGTWTIRTSPSSQNLHAVAFGASKYISAGAVAECSQFRRRRLRPDLPDM